MRYQEQFIVPKIGASVNEQQLKEARKKILKQSYEQQIQQKQNINKIQQNPQSSPIVDIRDINRLQLLYKNQIQAELSKSYNEESKKKLNEKKNQRLNKLEEEQNFIENMKKRQNEERLAERQKQISQRKQIIQNYHEELKKKDQNRRRPKDEIGILDMQIYSEKQFKQQLENSNHLQEKIMKTYEQKWIPLLKNRSCEKDVLIEKRIRDGEAKLIDMHQKQKQILTHRKFIEKDGLLQQIQDIRKKKEDEHERKKQQKLEGYVHPIYRHQHNPIYNPIDFKLAHDNKYILTQMKQGMSGLARSGSNTILS